jgi:hypothetical protein
MKFVGREGHELYIERFEVDGDFPKRLDGIGVDWNTGRFAQCGQFAYRLKNTRFVVGQHQRDQGDRLAPGDPIPKRLKIDLTGRLAWQVTNLTTLLLEPLSRRKDTWVLDRRYDDATAAFCG